MRRELLVVMQKMKLHFLDDQNCIQKSVLLVRQQFIIHLLHETKRLMVPSPSLDVQNDKIVQIQAPISIWHVYQSRLLGLLSHL